MSTGTTHYRLQVAARKHLTAPYNQLNWKRMNTVSNLLETVLVYTTCPAAHIHSKIYRVFESWQVLNNA